MMVLEDYLNYLTHEFERRFWYVFKLILSYAQLKAAFNHMPSQREAEMRFRQRINELKERFNVDVTALEKVLDRIKQGNLSGREVAELNDIVKEWCIKFLLQAFEKYMEYELFRKE